MSNRSSTKLKNLARERDNNTCQMCGFHHEDMNLDVHHIEPLVNNGADELSNMITLCRFCHKGAPHDKYEFFDYIESDRIRDVIESIIDEGTYRQDIRNEMDKKGITGTEEDFIYKIMRKIIDNDMISEYEYYRFKQMEGHQKAMDDGKLGQPKKDIDIKLLRTERLKPVSERSTWKQLEKDFGCSRSTLISRLKEVGYWNEEKRCVI